jgi:hypothetical protein
MGGSGAAITGPPIRAPLATAKPMPRRTDLRMLMDIGKKFSNRPLSRQLTKPILLLMDTDDLGTTRLKRFGARNLIGF